MTVQTPKLASQSAFDKSAKANQGLVVPIQGIGADAYSANGTLSRLEERHRDLVAFAGVTPFVATQQALAKTAVGRL